MEKVNIEFICINFECIRTATKINPAVINNAKNRIHCTTLCVHVHPLREYLMTGGRER